MVSTSLAILREEFAGIPFIETNSLDIIAIKTWKRSLYVTIIIICIWYLTEVIHILILCSLSLSPSLSIVTFLSFFLSPFLVLWCPHFRAFVSYFLSGENKEVINGRSFITNARFISFFYNTTAYSSLPLQVEHQYMK